MNTDYTRLRESMSLRDKLKAAQQVVDLANSSGYLPAVQKGLATPAKRKSIARSALRGAVLGVGALGAGALGATALARGGLLYGAYKGARATGKTFRDSIKAARTWGRNEMLPLGYVLARDLPNVVRYAPKAAGVGAVLGANYRLYKGFSDKRRKKQMESTNQCFGRLLEIKDDTALHAWKLRGKRHDEALDRFMKTGSAADGAAADEAFRKYNRHTDSYKKWVTRRIKGTLNAAPTGNSSTPTLPIRKFKPIPAKKPGINKLKVAGIGAGVAAGLYGAHRLRKWYKNRQEKKRQVESLRVVGNLREMSPQRAAWAAETAMKAYKNPHIPALRKGLRKNRYPSTLYSMANKFARYARKKETMMDTLYNPVKLPSFVGSAYRSGA